MHEIYNPTPTKNTLNRTDQANASIRRAKAGDRESLGQLIATCEPYLMSIARKCIPRSLSAKVDAVDLLQETAIDVHRGIAFFEGDTLQELCGWMRQILTNNSAGMRRRFLGSLKRDIGREVPDCHNYATAERLADSCPTPSQIAIGCELRVRLLEIIDQLPSDQKTAIILRHRERLTFTEIGKQLGRSGDAARKLWARAVERVERDLRHDSCASDA
jgi:RNA polymerase sigma-70 factor (ECF subfamily)